MRVSKLVCLLLLTLDFSAAAQTPPSGAGLRPVQENGKWGYADRTGRVVIQPHFEAARDFAGGLAQVGVLDQALPEVAGSPNLKWGYIDESGRFVIAPRYHALRDFVEGLAAAAVLDTEQPETFVHRRGKRPNLKWGFVDRQGREVVLPQFLYAGDFSEGLAQVDVGAEGSSSCGRPPAYGYIDQTGALRIQPRFATAGAFQGGRARVGVGRLEYMGRCLCCAPRFTGTYGYVNRDGEFTPDEPPADGRPLNDPEGW